MNIYKWRKNMDHSNHYIVTYEILNKWRNSVVGWNKIISPNVYFGKTNNIFPIPDSTIIDEDNNYGSI
jgi:hypothetical protein